MYEYFLIVTLILLATAIFFLYIESGKRKFNDKVIEDQTGYINYLMHENEQLREKLYRKYDPQKYQQEWQEIEEEQPLPTGTHGRFSGGGF